MPVTDAQVGITELLGSHRPFRAVVKQTVDDFVVNEVLLSGKIAVLTQLARATPPRSKSEPRPEPEAVASPAEISYEKLDLLFTDAAAKPSDLIRSALDARESSVTLPICADKATRTLVHAWVRENLPAYVTDTVDTKDGQAVRLRRKDMCRPWKRRRTGRDDDKPTLPDASNADTYDPREGKPQGERSLRVGPNTYVRFILWKRNRDTTEALSILGKILRVPASAFTYAGTKDKRAVTTQLVQVRGISEGRFAHANRVLERRERGFRSMAAGNVEIVPRGGPRNLGLGDLRGNRFTLALRDLELDEDGSPGNVMAAVESLKERGFVNYFGLQRFGSGVSPTHETGFAFLRGDFEDVCQRILLPLRIEKGEEGMRPERKRFVAAMEKFARREISAQELLPNLPGWMHIERAVAESFAEEERRGIKKYDYKKAFSKLPRNLRRMYGHAVQSYLWNVMASQRIRIHRPDGKDRLHAIEGDLVLTSGTSQRELNYETKVRTVTGEEERNRSVSVYDVLIPVVGSEVSVPDTDYGKVARTILDEQNLDLKSRLSSEYGMKGTYRPLIARPQDVMAKVVTYKDKQQSLIPSGVDHLTIPDQDGTGTEEPVPGHDTKLDPNPVVQDAQTSDAEKIVGRSSPTVVQPKRAHKDSAVVGTDPKGSFDNLKSDITPAARTDETSQALETKRHSRGESADANSTEISKRSALVLSFTLGCAEYATMLVRELTRHDSSTANQKTMQDGLSAGAPKASMNAMK